MVAVEGPRPRHARSTPISASRFVREAQLLRRVHSPHVVAVHDSGELDDGRPYFVMEYADGGSLEDRLGLTPPGRVDPKSPDA